MIAAICAATIWINLTKDPWNAHDKKIYKRAVQVCGTDVRYKDSPCVAKFIKKPERTYNVLCGGKK